jgi:hypothetical protein
MNMQRPHCGLLAGILLGLLAATPLALGDPRAPAPAAAAAPVTPSPAAPEETTATAKAPATMVIDRQAGGNDVLLDLNVTAFRPPRHGAVEALVTLQENKPGGREVDVGSFSVFPARKFKASKPDDQRGFRLDAMQALTDLGMDNTAVKVKVRLVPLHDGQSAAGARLTLSKVRFVPRDEAKDDAGGDGKDNAGSRDRKDDDK